MGGVERLDERGDLLLLGFLLVVFQLVDGSVEVLLAIRIGVKDMVELILCLGQFQLEQPDGPSGLFSLLGRGLVLSGF